MMIVRFTTGKQFSPQIQARVDIFTSRHQMKNGNSIYTGLEPLKIAAQNAALKVGFERKKEVDIVFNGYLPDYSRNLVTSPFTERRITVNFKNRHNI